MEARASSSDRMGDRTRERLDDLRAHLHGMWAAVAGSWAEHAEYVDARGAAVTERMLELTPPQPGERVLELACGPGGLGLAAAERVAPGGEVVLSDVAAEMTAIAAARAERSGSTNVSTRELDLERIDQPDGSYDVVLCREGLMLVPDPARAAARDPAGPAARRTGRARGVGPARAQPVARGRARRGERPDRRAGPSARHPGPFSLEDADRLAGLLSGAGLSDVAVSELPTPLRAALVRGVVDGGRALAGPLAQRLRRCPRTRAGDPRPRAGGGRPYETPAGWSSPGSRCSPRPAAHSHG